MRLVIAGGTGFIGSVLCTRLLEQRHLLTVLTRSAPSTTISPSKRWLTWEPGSAGAWENALEESLLGADGVINLVGEPIAAKRWTPVQKEKIRLSRVNTTRALVNAIAKAKDKPKFLLNGSAVGFYGPHGDDPLSEESGPGKDFLARLCVDWEEEAKRAERYGLRVIRLRTGIVLGKGGGALAKMIPPFKFFIGGPLGTGKQWMSWIHLVDEVGLILFLIQNDAAHGPINATAPNPVTMKEFSTVLGRVMHRPSWTPVPSLALRLLLGEMADMLLTGQRVLPAQAQKLGYTFRHPRLDEALKACLEVSVV